MYDQAVRDRVLAELASGISMNALSKKSGVSRAAIREWRDNHANSPRLIGCPRCDPDGEVPPRAYAHLLGLYLGDGCLSELAKRVYSLRISCDAKYPFLVESAARAIEAVHPAGKVHLVNAPGCVVVLDYWKHWPCLFPQHGPGRKHQRPIVLADWQRETVARHPGQLLRGLFHSDGCRVTNWTVRPLAAGPKRYEYPRYFFSNESADIIGICTDALDLLGIRWRMNRPNSVSVARREAVTALDVHVGIKL